MAGFPDASHSAVKLLVIGATGTIGLAVVNAALDRGHEVTAVVRSPEKLGDLRDRVRVIAGDLTDADVVAAAVAGHDAVISAIGSSPDRAQLGVPATAMRNLLAGMSASGVRRVVGLAGGAVDVPGERKPLVGRIVTAFVRLMARNVVEAKQREFDVVRASDRDWTMVRPPNVVDGPPSGVAPVIGDRLSGFRITSGDLGIAMVELAGSSDWLSGAPYVSTGRPASR
jgi:putative NADH-flavin reductase